MAALFQRDGPLKSPGHRARGHRAHKYGAKPTTVDGIKFPSRKEARRYQELRLLERAGEITHLERQPVFPIVIRGTQVRYPSGIGLEYRADFRYFDCRRGRMVVEDVKGVRKSPRPPGVKKPRHEGTDTDAAKIKRAIVAHLYGITIDLV